MIVASETADHESLITPYKVCPNCASERFQKILPAGRIHREALYRERFVLERFNRKPKRQELKDLTEFTHDEDAALLACSDCGVFVRDELIQEAATKYEEDTYDEAHIDLLLPRYVQAFRDKKEPYRKLLAPGSKVLEIGSHYGAFLQVAIEWGWHPAGVDIGKDTSRYAKSKGYLVFDKELEDCALPGGIFDGVFVWNCFEQVPAPHTLLREIRRILKRDGLLVVRTPNAIFYELCEAMLQDGNGTHEIALSAMAYNNLLAFPYLYGYNSVNLNQLVSSEGFRLEGMLNSELLTLPLPEVPDWVAEEQRTVSARIDRMNREAVNRTPGLLTGPWMELYYRAE